MPNYVELSMAQNIIKMIQKNLWRNLCIQQQGFAVKEFAYL